MLFSSGRGLVAGVCLAASLFLTAPASATTIDDVSFGPTWYGETQTPASLRGRVVVIEFWGYN
ncbi:MAG: hypothetical protein HYZ53_24335 [Planctomycetes bacterium]|nr:hypothetical protein [Planctomycetota bacterium]